MVGDLHSWIAAGRAPPVLCTHSGSLEATSDKGKRHWEIMGWGSSCTGIQDMVWSVWSGAGEARLNKVS